MLCWGPEEDWAGIRGGACLGMLHNIHLRGRYLLKFQLLREMAEAERGLAFALQRGAVFLPQASVPDLSQGKKSSEAKQLQPHCKANQARTSGGCCWTRLHQQQLQLGLKIKNMKKSLSTGKTSPNVCFEKKSMKKGLFGLIYPLFSLSLPRPPTLPHLSGSLTPTLRPLPCGWQHGSCREVGRGKESHFHCSLAPPAPCCPQDPPHASCYSRAPLHLTLHDGAPRGTPC